MAVVAIFNTFEDTVMLLRYLLEREGFQTVNAYVQEIRKGEIDLVAFLAQHRPDVVIYDVPPPFPDQWNFLRMIRNLDVLRGVPFVITTTNKPALQRVAGEAEVLELISKPYDFHEVVNAVKAALAARRARPPGQDA